MSGQPPDAASDPPAKPVHAASPLHIPTAPPSPIAPPFPSDPPSTSNPISAPTPISPERFASSLSFLSHDLRSSLHGVLLMIEVVGRDLAPIPATAESRNDLALMRRSVLETVGLMERFVYAERFAQGLVRNRSERVDLFVVGEQMRALFVPDLPDTAPRLHVLAAGTLQSDRTLVGLLLSGLLRTMTEGTPNATPPENLHLTLEAAGGHLSARLSSDGPGLTDSLLALLSTPPTLDLTTPHFARELPTALTLSRLAAQHLGLTLSHTTHPRTRFTLTPTP